MTIFGWDMSHFDSPGIGNAEAEGISFITHKAGGDANDSEIGTWWSGVKGIAPSDMLLGAYWVLYPGSPSARADAFISRLDATCPGWRDRPFLLQVDCEKWNGDPSTVPGKSDIKTFCDRLVVRMSKLRPIVYAPEWVYGNTLTGLGYPLWASSYVGGAPSTFKGMYPGDSSSKWGSYSGQTPAILQYTSSASIGGQGTSDANAFRGTLNELMALVAPGWSNDVELTDNLVDSAGKNWGSVNGALITLLQRTDDADNKKLPAMATVLGSLSDEISAVGTKVDTVLDTPAEVDVAALVAALVPAIVAALPPGAVITPAELQTALVGAFRELAAG